MERAPWARWLRLAASGAPSRVAVASVHAGASPTRGHASCTARWILKHCTTREASHFIVDRHLGFFPVFTYYDSSFSKNFIGVSFKKFLMEYPIFPGASEGKASARNAGDPGSIPGSGRSPGEGKGNPLRYSCLENPMDGETWWAAVHGAEESRTRLTPPLPFVVCWFLWYKLSQLCVHTRPLSLDFLPV